MNYFSSFLHVRDRLIDRAAHVDFPVPRTVLECFHLTHTVMHMSREKHEDRLVTGKLIYTALSQRSEK